MADPNRQVDDAHHIYTYTLEVTDPTIQVDIRLDFADSENIEVVEDENVLMEDDRYVVVGTIMPMTSQLICKIKAYDTVWNINCQVTMIKRSAPVDIQATNMEPELIHLDRLIKFSQQKWGSKALGMASLEEIKQQIQLVRIENEDRALGTGDEGTGSVLNPAMTLAQVNIH